MVLALFTEVVEHDRSVVLQLVGLLFAVDDAHRVALEAVRAGLAEFVLVRGEVILERLLVDGTAVRAADRVDLQLEAFDAEEPEDFVCEGDDFRVLCRARRAEALDAELVELAEPAGLGFLVPVAGGQVVDLHRARLVEQSVFKERADRAGGALRTKGDGPSALVVEGVHLLLYDVRGIAHRPVEQFGMFEDGSADLSESVVPGDIGQSRFQKTDFVAVHRERVLCAFDGFRNERHGSSSKSE